MRPLRRLLAGLTLVAAIAAGSASPADADPTHRALATIMTGGQEVPGPGDNDGVGAAAFLVTARGRLCYVLAVKNIAPANAAHIHRDATGVIAVGLNAPTSGFSAACTTINRDLAAEIIAAPEDFYVNVHNADFPAGAVRGQLG